MKESMKAVTAVLSVLLLSTLILIENASAAILTEKNGAYDVFTHVIVGTNSKGTRTLNRELAAALAAVRPDFEYQFYFPQATYFLTVADGGNLNMQSMTRRLGSLEVYENPVFWELNYGAFNPDKANPGSVAFRSFSYQARIPLRFKGIEKNPENVSAVRYENIRIGLANFRLELGTPKLIATLPLPDNGETLFFVTEVRRSSAE